MTIAERNKLAIGAANAKEYGVVGNGTTNDTAAMQSAINANYGKTLFVPPEKYRLTSRLNIVGPITIVGIAPGVKNEWNGPDQFIGTWFYFDHVDNGIKIGVDLSTYFTDVTLDTISFVRNQPTPGSGWTPTEHAHDILVVRAADVNIVNCMHLRSTNGIYIQEMGRINIYKMRGQFFKNAIYVERAYDIVRVDQLHIWPFWQDSAFVHAYTKLNLDVIISERNDDPFFSNIFAIFCHSLIRFAQNAQGKTGYFQAINIVSDISVIGIYVDTSVTDGVTGQFCNLLVSGMDTTPTIGFGIYIQGNNCKFNIVNFDGFHIMQNVVRIEGTGNYLQIGQPKFDMWDVSNLGWAAFDIAAGNQVRLTDRPVWLNSDSLGAGVRYNGSGLIFVDEWIPYAPALTAQIGAITAGTIVAKYKLIGNTTHIAFDATIANNNTGSGTVRIGLPFVPNVVCTGNGREINITGHSVTITGGPGTAYADIAKFDNTYPGGTSYRIAGSLSYEINI